MIKIINEIIQRNIINKLKKYNHNNLKNIYHDAFNEGQKTRRT